LPKPPISLYRMSFALTVLGSSSAIPTSTRFQTAQVLNVHERFFLIDCGEGTQIQLRRFSINSSRINHVFISHLHGDHIFGLFGLLSSYNLMGRKSDLHVYAHHNLEVTLDHFRKYFGFDMSYKIVFHPLTASKSLEIYNDKHITVETIPLRHSVPVMGFIFREKQKPLNVRKEAIEKYSLGIRDIKKIKEGLDHTTPDGRTIANRELTLPPFKPRSYAFCTDTSCFLKLKDSLKDIDLLYFEATFAEKDKKLAKITGHSTASQAATLAKQAHVGKLLIGHFSTRYKNIGSLVKEARLIFKETTAVEDGDKYAIDQKRVDSRV
jgi:ribonuclease Z